MVIRREGATVNCECGGEYILDGSWYVCQECHEVAGDFSEYEDSEDDDESL